MTHLVRYAHKIHQLAADDMTVDHVKELKGTEGLKNNQRGQTPCPFACRMN